MRESEGKLTWVDGSSYEGDFKNNKIEGFGTYIIVENLMECILMIKNKEMTFFHLEIGKILCGTGIMANNTEHKLLKTRMGRKKKVNGFKVK